MFQIDLSSKRGKLAIRFFTYGVMTIATVGITIICLLLAYGYRFDRQSLSFQQGGLIQISSTPAGGEVWIDGVDQNYVTPGKSDIAPILHTVELKKQGYQTWSKTVPLAASQLLWLNYAHLLPNAIKTTVTKEFDSLVGMKISPDHHWLVLQATVDKPEFSFIDVSDGKKPVVSTITIPDSMLTKKDGVPRQFSMMEWDRSSQYLLVRYQTGDAVEYLRLNRSHPDQTVNISQTFQLPMSDIHFSASSPDLLYVKNDTVLRRLDLNAKTATGALISDLRAFDVSQTGTIIYTATRLHTASDPASVYQLLGLFDRDKEVPVRELGSTTNVVVDYADYFNHGYLAVSDTTTQTVDIIRDPLEAGNKGNRTFATMQLAKPATWLSFSGNGRMILAQTGNNATSYDLEIAAQYQYEVQTGAPVTRPFQWLDDYYLMSDAGRTIKTFEFDGKNGRNITGAEEAFGASFSQDNTYLYSIGHSANTKKYLLQVSRLILP